MDDLEGQNHKGSLWRHPLVVVAIIGALAGIITTSITVVVPMLKSDPGGQRQASPVSSRSSSPAPSPSPSVLGDSPTPTPAEGVQYLSDLPSIDGDNRIKTATLGDGKTYSHSVRSVNPFERYTFVYAIEGEWKFFVATLGIDRGAPDESVAHFQVYLNGAPYGSGDVVGKWETKEVRIPVTGKSEIKLVTSTQKGATKVRSVWGDARFSG